MGNADVICGEVLWSEIVSELENGMKPVHNSMPVRESCATV